MVIAASAVTIAGDLMAHQMGSENFHLQHYWIKMQAFEVRRASMTLSYGAYPS